MHREISHSDATFAPESPLPLYLFTGFLAALLGLDLYPKLAAALGWSVPWASEIFGYRYALIAAVIGGARVLYGSLQGLLEGKLGADLALAIACLAAILMNEPLVAAEVVFIGMVGECLEAFTFARTQNAIRKIVEVFPIRCWKLENGQEVRVFTNALHVGDRVVVKPGAKIPVDGVVLEGRSYVDCSPLTGESLPLDKGQGDEVLAGSINKYGTLTIEAKKIAEQTVAGKVVELTAKALKDKTSGERIADQMARYFLPMVLGLALLTFVGAFVYYSRFRTPAMAARSAVIQSMYPTLAVLVVTCPCALILATPAAIMAALARLAGTGVLIKSGRAIEKLAEVTSLAIDKTGTLTEGRLVIRGVHPLAGVDADELLRVAARAERPSEHPLGRAVVSAATSRGWVVEAPTKFQAFAGAGVSAEVDGAEVFVGTRRSLEEHGVVWPPEAKTLAETLDAAGQTPLWVASQGWLLGALGAQDHPRPEAAGVVTEFRDLGISPIVMLTGDRRAAARAIGQDLGISDIAAELLPHEKAERIKSLMKSGKVAMIGDGINDAPALARADVGLAISGIDLAAEAGDVVLLGDPLRHLPLLIRLSRQTVRIIRQNILWFAFGVNLVGILVTSWLWPLFAPANWVEQSPLAAVIYHQLGSLAVLLNSMRLLWFEPSKSSPTLANVNNRLHTLDLWIDHAFDLHEWSHWAYEHRKRVIFGTTLFGLIAYAACGLTIVRPDEVAVIRRFGRPLETLGPGWHWRWPWPIEDAVRVSDRIRTVEIGFRESLESLASGSWTWTSAHRKNREANESIMITGDGNLVDVQAVLRYKVVDPRMFLFEVADVDKILRDNAEATLRALVAGRPFHDLLTVGREQLQSEVLGRLRETCTAYGVELLSLSLLDLHPPGEVVEAYYEVAKAMERRDKKINDAERDAAKTRKDAEAESVKIVSGAKAAATEKTLGAAADTLKFLERSKARRELSAHQEMQLQLDGVELALRGEGDVEKTIAEKRRKLIASQMALSDFRAFWETIGQALTGRPMILVDSDNVPGQRNLFLIDPDLLRPVTPFINRFPMPKEP